MKPVGNLVTRQQQAGMQTEAARNILEALIEGDIKLADELLDDIIERRREWRSEARPCPGVAPHTPENQPPSAT